MTIQSGDRIVVETPAARRRRLVSMGIIATGVSLVLVVDRSDGTTGLVIGILAFLFFGPITLVQLLRGIRKLPVLILDSDGFTDRSTLLSPGFVPWPEVQQIEERPFRRRTFVTVTVTDRAAFRARQPAWRRLLLRINGPMVSGDILIPDNVLPMSPAELVKTMRRLQRGARHRTHN
jgi:hypothetical protein